MIVDTKALSAFADGPPHAIGALEAAGEVSVPVIVLREFLYGIAHSRRHREYELWLEQYLPAFFVLESYGRNCSGICAASFRTETSWQPHPRQ